VKRECGSPGGYSDVTHSESAAISTFDSGSQPLCNLGDQLLKRRLSPLAGASSIGAQTRQHGATRDIAVFASTNKTFAIASTQRTHMSITQPESKKHHFVPRSLLRYFCVNDSDEFIYSFDKSNGRVFRSSLMNAGSENNFNVLEAGSERVNFEDDFRDVDGLLATRLREVHEARDLSFMTARHRRDWAELIAVQLLRTPIIRSTMTSMFSEINAEVFEKLAMELGMPAPTDNDAREVARSMFKDRQNAIDSLVTKDFVLFETSDALPFRISDRPVTLHTSLPFGDTGLSSLGVAVFMPLGRNLMLGLYCPSILKTLKKTSLSRSALSADARGRLEALKEGLQKSATVRLDQSTVAAHNAEQISQCARFVYGPTDAFDDARILVDRNPKIRSVKSSFTIGRMGEGPGPRRDMPLGEWLVLIGPHEAIMLEVADVSAGYPFEATVQDGAALMNALRAKRFNESQYFSDRRQQNSMRDVQLIDVQNGVAGRVHVRHTEPSLDGLMASLQR
jgi:hypothetical protein